MDCMHVKPTGVRLLMQLREVLGPDNVWFCSECYNQPVRDVDTLWRYFVEHGGAADFAQRWIHAMSDVNRYYASKHFGKEITDERILWEYYVSHGGARIRSEVRDNGWH